MQLQIKQSDLARIVGIAASAVTGKSTLPILFHVHLAVNLAEKTVRATGTNLAHWAEATAPLVSQSALEFEDDAENGEVIATAASRQFLALISSLPGTSMVDIGFETRGITTRDLHIEAAGTKSKLPGLPWEQFPLPPEIEAIACVTMPAGDLLALVDHVKPCVSTDDSRPVLTTIYFEVADNRVKAVATNTHQLGTRSVAAPNMTGQINAMVPTAPLLSALQTVRKAGKDATVHLEFTAAHLRLTTGDTRYSIRLMEGLFPNYQRVIPTDFDREIIADRHDLMDAISRSLIASADNVNRVILETVDGYSLSVSGQSATIGEIASTIEISREGEPTQFAANGQYLKQAISVLEGCDGCRIRMNEPLRPMVVVGSGEGVGNTGDALTVVMPMQVF